MKVIEPLFLDDLRAELRKIKGLRTGRRKRLEAFQDKLSKLTFFDPACGCGNFLIIAYRELRNLELEVMQAIKDMGQLALLQSVIDVDQFYGIEYEEFPARIAETALWMMDHIMNRKLSDQFGELFVRIPLEKKATIVHGDALEVDWNDVLPAAKCSFVLGNPPFIGANNLNETQRRQVQRIANLQGRLGTLDYVCAWFIKSGEYVEGDTRIAFVSTNSVVQGEQVAQLWPILFERCGLEILLGHRPFVWESEARGKAAVHCVILGLVKAAFKPAKVRLFSYDGLVGEPISSVHKVLSPHLVDAEGLRDHKTTVKLMRRSLDNRNQMIRGSGPTDGGHLILSEAERRALLSAYPDAAKFVRQLVGSKDSISGWKRYCLWLRGAQPSDIRLIPPILERVKSVRKFREDSKKPATKKDANRPTEFAEIRHEGEPFIVIQRHSSMRRDYVPFAFFNSGEIAHDSCQFMLDATLSDFAILTSKMHMAWLSHIGGRIKSDYRYSIGLVYNTFPLPKGDLSKLDALAQAVLEARASHPDSTLADLYDPDLMPPDLRVAHDKLDQAVDKMYRRSGFQSDRERVEHLFLLYEAMVKPLLSKPKRTRRKKPV